MNSLPQKLKTLASHVFPTIRLAILCLFLMLVEFTVLVTSPDQPFQEGGPIVWVALFWLVWFWLSASWAIFWAEKSLQQLDKQRPIAARGLRISLSVCGSIILLLHLCSWGMFKQIGQFANLEAFQFLIVNPPMSIWRDLTSIEKTAFSVVLVVVAGAMLSSSRMLQFFTTSSHEFSPASKLSKSQRYVWQLVTFMLVVPSFAIAADESDMRRSTWMHVVKTRMHPVATLSLSAAEQFFTEPVLPTLNEEDLTPLSLKWTPPKADSQRPSVIILAVESLRADTIHLKHQGREILPNINRLANEGVEFTSAYSQSTHSDYADVCIVSSLYPLRTRHHHYYSLSDPWPKTLAYDLFKKAGYATAIISSQNEGWGNMDQFLQSPNLDLFYDAARSGIAKLPDADNEKFQRDPGFALEVQLGTLKAGKLEDGQTMDRALDWVNEQVEKEQPFFLSMNFQSSHFPYEVPEDVEQPFQPAELAHDVKFMHYPEERTPQVKNAYYNGIHHCDYQIGRMVRELEKLKQLDNVILIVLGENGEALNENGYCGHAQEPVQPMVHVATVIRAPQYLKPAVENYPMEHVDVIPTVLGMLDWNPHPNFQGQDVLSADRLPANERLLFFHTNVCSNESNAVILGGRWKLLDHRHWQRTELYDLASDPTESVNVMQQNPSLAKSLEVKLQTWRNNQLAYYHYFNYFSRFYPPQKPTWDGQQTSSAGQEDLVAAPAAE